MYLFDFRRTVDQLRTLLQTMPNAPGRWGAWAADITVEREFAVQAVEFLYNHLVQYEQFTAAAHLLAWAVPVDIRDDARIKALVVRSVEASNEMESPEREVLIARAGIHELTDQFMTMTSALPPRAAYWLHCVRLRGCTDALEFGTGCGSNVIHAAQIEPSVNWWGTDASKEQIEANLEQAQRLGLKNAHFIYMDKEDYRGRFPSVAVLDVLEHTAYPEQLLEKAERFVDKGGILTAVVPKGPWSLHTKNDPGPATAGNHVNVSSVADMVALGQRRGTVLAAQELPGPVQWDINASACVTYRPAGT